MLKLNPKLTSITFFHLYLLFILTHLATCNGASILGLSSLRSSGLDLLLERSSCSEAAIGECVTEPEMEWETGRRALAAQQSNAKYISYETLRRNAVPCQRPGASYYNCPVGRPIRTTEGALSSLGVHETSETSRIERVRLGERERDGDVIIAL
ncbi:protein RALF-like 24 [Syzygium oleosum]|uniref:protein RALF-like 24 n=1 Tax=Syzygium oleosum TaxID=219896 RepID=UPI0011D1F0AD|nr:protein RALF-like 24 [Syzygium oleosum]